VTEHEICYLYREARNKVTQLQVLAELNDTDRNKIIEILVKNGEEIPDRVIRQLYRRLDALDAQISEREKEYRGIVRALIGGEG
jgi:transposase